MRCGTGRAMRPWQAAFTQNAKTKVTIVAALAALTAANLGAPRPAAADGSGLQGQGQATALGDALLAVLDEYRGRRVPQVVAFTDGRVNLGTPLRESRLVDLAVRVRVVVPVEMRNLIRINSTDDHLDMS